MPVILAANKLKIPTLLHESNAFPGVAVRLLSKKVNTVLVGFEDAKLRLKKAKNVVVTGNPTKIKKQNLTSNQKEEIIRSIGLNTNKPIVLVFGGSQGAKSINKSFINIIKNNALSFLQHPFSMMAIIVLISILLSLTILNK